VNLKVLRSLKRDSFYQSYVAVDLDIAKIENLRKSSYFSRPKCPMDVKTIVDDFNSVIQSFPMSKDHVFLAVNSLHHLHYHFIKAIVKSSARLSSFVMCSDLLFSLKTVETVSCGDHNLTYDPAVNLIKGTLAGLVIREKPLVRRMFPAVYPLKFMCPIKIPSESWNHFYWRSFAYVTNKPMPALRVNYPGELKRPIILVNAGFKLHLFNRPTMHTTTRDDLAWFSGMESFVSPKLNGVAAFMHFCPQNQVWMCSLRKGQTFVPYLYERDGRRANPTAPFTPNGSLIHSNETVYIELVLIGDEIYPFFLGVSKKKFVKKNLQAHWTNVMTPFSSKISLFKNTFSMLSFKPYYSSSSPQDRIDLLTIAGKRLPSDGIVINDQLFNYSSFWKPIETVDVQFARSPYASSDILESDDPPKKLKDRWFMPQYPHLRFTDPNRVLSLVGIYECIRNGQLIVVCSSRPDKSTSSCLEDLPGEVKGVEVVTTTKGTAVRLLGKTFNISEYTFDQLKIGLQVNYFKKTLDRILNTHMPINIVYTVYKSIHAILNNSVGVVDVGDNRYAVPVSLFENICRTVVPTIDHNFIWRGLLMIGFACEDSHEAPPVKFSGSYAPAFIFRKDFVFQCSLNESGNLHVVASNIDLILPPDTNAINLPAEGYEGKIVTVTSPEGASIVTVKVGKPLPKIEGKINFHSYNYVRF